MYNFRGIEVGRITSKQTVSVILDEGKRRVLFHTTHPPIICVIYIAIRPDVGFPAGPAIRSLA